jgi:undecaprenyl-diphosphatase
VLGIVQGLSEFLPISSSGHLIVVPKLFGWHDLGGDNSLNKSFDVALHLGTLVAALWYFRKDIGAYVVAAWQSIRSRSITTVNQRMAWLLLLSAVPGAIVGALLESVIEDVLGDPILIGINLIVWGLVLQWADRLAGGRKADDYHGKDAVVMGVAQAVALAPGVSRSGITMTAGRWMRFDRESAARLSFLMAIPITGGAVLYKGAELASKGGIPKGYGGAFVWGTIAAALAGLLAIAVLLKYLRSHSFLPFVIYRVALGIIVIAVFATGLR